MNDLRFAIRSLRRSPGFVLIAVVTLGAGMGAFTSTFSIPNEVLLRPLPYPDSGQLDRIYRATPQHSRGAVSPVEYLDLKPEMNGYGEIAAYAFADMNLSEPGRPAEMVPGLRISDNLLSTLGIQSRLGRSFRPDEALLGNHRVLNDQRPALAEPLRRRPWNRRPYRPGGRRDARDRRRCCPTP